MSRRVGMCSLNFIMSTMFFLYRSSRKVFASVLLLLLGFGLCACTDNKSGRISVAVTIPPLQNWAEQLAGGRVDIVCAVPDGGNPESDYRNVVSISVAVIWASSVHGSVSCRRIIPGCRSSIFPRDWNSCMVRTITKRGIFMTERHIPIRIYGVRPALRVEWSKRCIGH